MAIIGSLMLLTILILLAVAVGAIFLQIYLSRKESKWLGLILPIITFSLSLIVVMSMVAFIQPATLTETTFVNGELVTNVISAEPNREDLSGAIATVIYTFIFINIPTIVLLIIYKTVRAKQNRNRDVEKMSIQDL